MLSYLRYRRLSVTATFSPEKLSPRFIVFLSIHLPDLLRFRSVRCPCHSCPWSHSVYSAVLAHAAVDEYGLGSQLFAQRHTLFNLFLDVHSLLLARSRFSRRLQLRMGHDRLCRRPRSSLYVWVGPSGGDFY